MLTFLLQQEEYTAADRDHELELLLAQVAAGDRDSLEALYRRTRTAVYALALSYLKHHADAEDVSQTTFVRIWENAGQYRPQGKPRAWILAIARNLSLMELRRRGQADMLPPEQWELLPDHDHRLTAEDRQILEALLDTLDDRERRIVILHAVAGLRHREIAALLELPLSTVLSKYNRSLKKLRQQLKGDVTP